jgi:hypothetical protein
MDTAAMQTTEGSVQPCWRMERTMSELILAITDAKRVARGIIKARLKAKGIRVSHIKAVEITDAANDLVVEALRDWIHNVTNL